MPFVSERIVTAARHIQRWLICIENCLLVFNLNLLFCQFKLDFQIVMNGIILRLKCEIMPIWYAISKRINRLKVRRSVCLFEYLVVSIFWSSTLLNKYTYSYSQSVTAKLKKNFIHTHIRYVILLQKLFIYYCFCLK